MSDLEKNTDDYKIEIWQYHSKVEEFKSNDIKEILEWYKLYWEYIYENGGCCYYVYKNNNKLSFDEEYKLGFE